MNWDQVEGNWKQFKGKIKEQWGKLTDDHLDTIAGKRDQLAGKIQESYGISKDEAEKQIAEWGKNRRTISSILLLYRTEHHVAKATCCATNFYCWPSKVIAKEAIYKFCFVSIQLPLRLQ